MTSIGYRFERRRLSPSPEQIEEKFQMIEQEHENIPLLLHYHRVFRDMNESNPLYSGAEDNLRLQMASTGVSTGIRFLTTDSDSELLFKLKLLIRICRDNIEEIRSMSELTEGDRIRTDGNYGYNCHLLEEEIPRAESDIKRRAETERNYSRWLDSTSDQYL